MHTHICNGILHIRSRDNYGDECTFLTYYINKDSEWIHSPQCCLSFDLTHPNLHPVEMCRGCDYVHGIELAFNTMLEALRVERETKNIP